MVRRHTVLLKPFTNSDTRLTRRLSSCPTHDCPPHEHLSPLDTAFFLLYDHHSITPRNGISTMDKPFDACKWAPSLPWQPWDKQYPIEKVTSLITSLNQETDTILRFPYDPCHWLRRGKILASLRYPELAAGDGLKAMSLARKLLADLEQRPSFRLGYRMGFWMGDAEPADAAQVEVEREELEECLTHLQRAADKVVSDSLYYLPNYFEGRMIAREYPWMNEDHKVRSDELLNTINREFAISTDDRVDEMFESAPLSSPCPIGSPCIVKRYAFGEGIGARNGADLLGVFASALIFKGETILIDTTRTWGCNGPGSDGTLGNLCSGLGCLDELHPNSANDSVGHDMRWIRDRTGKESAEIITRCKLFFVSVLDGVKHPLDHNLAARLTPTYREKFTTFSLENDIAVMNDFLQQIGIDIFANHNYDTWTYFTIKARVENNSCSDPNTAAVHHLFSLFNHSCEPNVSWFRRTEDHRTMHMVTTQDVSRGEQLFISYDGFMEDKPLEGRRKRFRRWINGPCQCTRCMREEAQARELLGQSFSSSPSGSSGDWDNEEKPRLPEDDFVNATSRLCEDDSDSRLAFGDIKVLVLSCTLHEVWSSQGSVTSGPLLMVDLTGASTLCTLKLPPESFGPVVSMQTTEALVVTRPHPFCLGLLCLRQRVLIAILHTVQRLRDTHSTTASMKRFGVASRGIREGSTSTQANTTASPFDSDRPHSVTASREVESASGLGRTFTAFSPRATFGRCRTSPVQRHSSFIARLNSLRQRYGRNGDRPASPSISQPTDVRLVHRGSPVNYIIAAGSPPQQASNSPDLYIPGRSSSLGFSRFDDLPPSPLASHPVTAEDFHSVASHAADEKHFRCIIHINNVNDYREAELILKGMVAESGGRVLDATHRWPGGFFYSTEGALGENPLEDGAESPRGGHIDITPFDLSEPISFKGIRSGTMRANLVEIPPYAESRLRGKLHSSPEVYKRRTAVEWAADPAPS
ncbi:hypothetical protein DOTSEDRAFT_76727 [Dothistroma septosporum NZE10]|uniref:SET domain-containing protein n=1 Tax=Dothistroma septosporum (strain NZE10 / CBS 128990) TaxID=675120 RepID=N1Q3Z0_DOTSN|nr:hypothetical protein DOTSEDRAFT_76727 [Dothistroma septosporum NZE10]